MCHTGYSQTGTGNPLGGQNKYHKKGLCMPLCICSMFDNCIWKWGALYEFTYMTLEEYYYYISLLCMSSFLAVTRIIIYFVCKRDCLPNKLKKKVSYLRLTMHCTKMSSVRRSEPTVKRRTRAGDSGSSSNGESSSIECTICHPP